jgi:molybdenum cofactor cytidylyltransferase
MIFGCLILAAGQAKRMGTQKLVLNLFGKPLLQHVVDLAKGVGFKEVLVVTGADEEVIRRKVDLSGCTVLSNPNHKEGMASSLRLGFAALAQRVDALVVMLGDQPFVQVSTVKALVRSHERTEALITIPLYREQRGNPVILSSRLIEEVSALSGDTGARVLFKKYSSGTNYVVVEDRGVVLDIDTPGDFEEALNQRSTSD